VGAAASVLTAAELATIRNRVPAWGCSQAAQHLCAGTQQGSLFSDAYLFGTAHPPPTAMSM
jgi:hypothetical protein